MRSQNREFVKYQASLNLMKLLTVRSIIMSLNKKTLSQIIILIRILISDIKKNFF